MDIEAYRSYGVTFQIKNSDGSDRDLTGETITIEFKKTVDDAAAFITLGSGSGLSITAGTGTIGLALSVAQTTSMLGYVWLYDIKSSEGSVVQTYVSGRALVRPVVTR